MENQKTREINVKDLLYYILRKWRTIIFAAFILAVLLGAYRLGTGIKSMRDPENTSKTNAANQMITAEYELKREELEVQASNARTAVTEMMKYREQSILLRIDPLNEWVGTVTLYIPPQNQLNPAQDNPDLDLAGSLLAAYNAYLTGGEMYNEIAQQCDSVEAARYLSEITTTNVDSKTASIRITCIGDSEALVTELSDLVRQGLEKKHQELCESMREHDAVILKASCYSIVDAEMYNQQWKKLTNLDQYIKAKQDAETELSNLKEPALASPMGLRLVIKQAVKSGIIGLIAGVFVMSVVYGLSFLFSDTMKSENDWKATGLTVLARIRLESGKERCGKISAWIERNLRSGGARLKIDEGCALATERLSAMLQTKEKDSCLLVSDVAEQIEKTIAEKLNNTQSGITFHLVNSLLSKPGALKKVNDTDNIVLLCQDGVTTMDTIRQELALLHACGKKSSGVIVLEL